MTHLRSSGLAGTCFCGACGPATVDVSRRQFLCSAAAVAVAAPAATGSAAYAQSTPGAQVVQGAQVVTGAGAPGRPILIKGGCVLSLDRAVGDFEQADVLIEGTKISAVRPSITAANAEVIDAADTIVMPGF